MWLDIVFAALILGLLVKTNLIEDRVKKLGSHAEGESKRREDEAGRERDPALDESSDDRLRGRR